MTQYSEGGQGGQGGAGGGGGGGGTGGGPFATPGGRGGDGDGESGGGGGGPARIGHKLALAPSTVNRVAGRSSLRHAPLKGVSPRHQRAWSVHLPGGGGAGAAERPIVADHFYLVALGNQAVTEVRRRVTLDATGKRGLANDPIWAKRNRLLRGRERLSPAQFTKMWNALIDGDPSGQILTAWIAKEELRALLATDRTGGTRHDVAHRLFRFNSWCADSGVPELERLAGTIEAWWPQVPGFLQTNATNAGTESTNRTVKTVARTAYGFRNLDNQRLRVRFACTRRHRRDTAS